MQRKKTSMLVEISKPRMEQTWSNWNNLTVSWREPQGRQTFGEVDGNEEIQWEDLGGQITRWKTACNKNGGKVSLRGAEGHQKKQKKMKTVFSIHFSFYEKTVSFLSIHFHF